MDFLSSNPWIEDGSSQLGSVKKLLSLATQQGYRFDLEAEEKFETQLKSYQSVQILNLLAKITEVEDELYAVSQEINRHVLDKETHDITSITLYESRLSRLSQLSDHLSQVVSEKDQLVKRLQSPHDNSNLQISAQQHRSVVEFFHTISPLLTDLSALLETIAWSSDNAAQLKHNIDKDLLKVNESQANITLMVEKMKALREGLLSML